MKNSSLGIKLLLAIITLALITYFTIQGVIYFHDPITTAVTYSYQAESAVSLSGFVVRQEQVLPGSASGLLRLGRSEGERVSAGGEVAVVYADQTALDRQTEIDALRAQIEQLQYAQEALADSEVSLKLDTRIRQSLLDFRRALTSDNLSDAEGHIAELQGLVLKRDYTYAHTGDAAESLSGLQGQLKTLLTQSAGSMQRISAPVSGLYSAVVDGFETVLTPENITSLTPSQLSAVAADPSVSSNVGKLILGDAWYYAASMTPEQAATLQKAGNLTLRFSKSTSRDLPVTLLSVSAAENGEVAVVFRGRYYLPQLTLLRQQSAQVVWDSVTGLRVPKESVRVINQTVTAEDGTEQKTSVTGLYCLVGMEARFKPVEVLYRGEEFMLVQPAGTTEKTRLRSGDEVFVTAHGLYDGKVIN